ncbi:serine/threonine protein kinase [Clostridium sp. FP2]|uniref:serine/threonine-protein kinase n=1 Tax=Clostridium sp. FP2 TaxID=2724481 RepID=UPI0013E9158F|nr:serine/threonine-protein kinase [Clostridium sp. FP2]MBZ9623497.1 serine/threonine protein kinase [Clostridium sp. FP2]
MLNPGRILDEKYEIIKVLGRGGMGTVYLCKNNRLGNFWAIKEVNGQWKDKIDFLAEPNLLKNLSHIGIVRIIDIFYEDDNLYIVEDYIEGTTLKEYVEANGSLSAELVTDISLQLCSILGYLHSFNPPIIYRDLKPANIMIKSNNKVVLIDFGIARTYKENQEGDTMILGSMGYIAPEQLINAQSNAQTDIYSLGATMFFMLTSKSINLPSELMFEKNYRSDDAKSLVSVIKKASAIDPKSRYSDVSAMRSALNANIDEVENEKTMFMNSSESARDTSKTVLVEDKKLKNRTKLIIISALACIIALVVILAWVMNNKAVDKNGPEHSIAPKSTEATVAKTTEVTKPKVEPAAEVVEKDTIVKGILDIKNPVILSSGTSNGKGKDKVRGKDKEKEKDKDKDKDKEKDNNEDKNQLVQYNLKPAASIANSKLSISLTSILIIKHDVIVTLNFENIAAATQRLDISKTYLVNDKNEATKSYNQSSTTMMLIPQSSGKQEVKLYFKDLDIEQGSYILKTVLSSTVNKDINLSVDVKKP